MQNLFGIEIKSKLPRIIDYFVSFHGEDYRELITERVLNTNIVPFGSPEDYHAMLMDRKKKELFEAKKKFVESIGLDATEDTMRVLFSTGATIFYSPIDYIYSGISSEINSKIEDDLFKMNLKRFADFLGYSIDSKEVMALIEILKENKPLFDEICTKEKDFDSKHKNIYSEYDRLKDIASKLNHKANITFLKKFESLLSDHDKEILKKATATGELDIRSLECYERLISIDSTLPTTIDSFSVSEEKLLESGNDYTRNRIKQERIKYYNSIGINLGDDYASYEASELCKSARPDINLVEDIVKIRDSFREEIKESVIRESLEYKEIKKALKEIPFTDGDGFTAEVVAARQSMVTTSIIEKDGTPVMCPNLFLYYSGYKNFSDILFTHELNHAIELQLLDTDERKAYCRSGFDEIEFDRFSEEDRLSNKKIRRFELFNEVINHRIAEEVTTMMHDDGFYILDDEDKAEIKGISNSSFGNKIIEPFYQRFKKEILESRITGNMDVLYSAVGEGNFLALNDQVIDLFTINKNKLFADLQNGRETEETKHYEEVIAKTKTIYSEIRKHQEGKELK